MVSRLTRRKDRFTRPTVLQLAEQKGLLRSRDLEALGVPRTKLRLMLGLNFMREMAPGVWACTSHWPPFSRAVIAAKRVPQGVVCLLSALHFHRLLADEPPEAWLAIGEKARRPRCASPVLRVVRFSGAALSEGIEHHVVQGVPVRVYSVAKTLADLFKYRNKLGYAVAVRALGTALRNGLCTQQELLRYGDICRVSRTLAPYLRVLEERWGVSPVTAPPAAQAPQPPSGPDVAPADQPPQAPSTQLSDADEEPCTCAVCRRRTRRGWHEAWSELPAPGMGLPGAGRP